MRFGRFEINGKIFYGLVDDDHVYELDNSFLFSNKPEVKKLVEDYENKARVLENAEYTANNRKIETDRFKTITMDYENFEFICRYLES